MAAIKKVNKPFLYGILAYTRQFSNGTRSQRYSRIPAIVGGLVGFTVSCYYVKQKLGRQNLLFSPVLAKEKEVKREERRQAMQTAREMRFLSFASVEYQGNIYMTPQDFLESVTDEAPRHFKEDKSERSTNVRVDLVACLLASRKVSGRLATIDARLSQTMLGH